MVDQFDLAQAMDARFLRQALDDHARTRNIGEVTRTHCIDCGEEIPEARRIALTGVVRCIGCAEIFEASERRR